MRPGARGFAALCGLLVAGCQLTPTFSAGYEPDPDRVRSTPLAGTLVVEPFSEEREPRYYNTTGRMFLTYVPFIPSVTLRFERLEESVRIQSEAIEAGGRGMTLGATQNAAPPFDRYYYPNSFARAVADDLAATGLFERVEYGPASEAARADLVLRGTLRQTPLRTSITSFGLGAAGVLLWLLPIPIAKTTAGVDLVLTLTDNESGDVVWEKQLSSEIHRYFTLYTSSAMVYGRGGGFSFNLVPPPSEAKVDRRSLFSWHFEALRRAMLESKAELADLLRDRRRPPSSSLRGMQPAAQRADAAAELMEESR